MRGERNENREGFNIGAGGARCSNVCPRLGGVFHHGTRLRETALSEERIVRKAREGRLGRR